jgi:hypothetical protein
VSEIALLSLSDTERRVLAAILRRCLENRPHPRVEGERRAALEILEQRLMEGLT